ncbi:MAG: ornithine carbamoyltransferase [Schwartzia sp. (in: firmicutes)]
MLKGKDLLSIHDLTVEEIEEILDLARVLKAKLRGGSDHQLLKGKTLGLIFEKASTRTRVSFEVGMHQLGGQAMFFSHRDLQLGRGEPIQDTARVLSRYLDGIMLRTFGHDKLVEFAQWATIPVINGLTDLLHPCQALTDLLTIREYCGQNLRGLKLAYVGDGNNMAHSLMYACAKMGIDFTIATPEGYEPDPQVVQNARADAQKLGTFISLTHDAAEAVKEADILYADTWISMGKEEEADKRRHDFAGYQVNRALLQLAAKRAIIMHCLPAHRGEEITADVFEENAGIIFEQSENRLHTQKAILALTMGR